MLPLQDFCEAVQTQVKNQWAARTQPLGQELIVN
jgi:hypothetical protein